MNILKTNLASTVLFVGLAVAAVFGMTSYAEAAEMPSACAAAAPTIENFKPYVYEDGNLHSFDYTVPGGTVPVVMNTEVGGYSLESRYSTFWPGTNPGERKVHVDVPSWYGIEGKVDVSLTVGVPAIAGTSTVCVIQKHFTVQLPAKPTKTSPSSGAAVTAPATPLQNAAEKAGKTGTTDNPWNSVIEKMKEKEGSRSSLVAALNKLISADKACKSWGDATWILLTIVSIALVLVIIDSLPYLLSGGGMRFGIALLALFLTMVGLWFMFDGCREYRWFPIIITIITLFTLAAPTNLTRKKRKH